MARFKLFRIILLVSSFYSISYSDTLYNIVDLGAGVANAINDNNQVVGRSGNRAVLWGYDNGNITETLLGPTTSNQNEAFDISKNGTIVGTVWLPLERIEAAVFNVGNDSSYQSLGDGFAYSINNSEVIAGSSYSHTSSGMIPTRWDLNENDSYGRNQKVILNIGK